ncbi:MAG: helix-turn-helix domain-containing protein [Ruminococcaceae bacterium]|nr:helix-turn-helix domain-containing protein [Oscillospiraceae bacterium]
MEKERRRWSSSGFCVAAVGMQFRVMTAGGSLRLPRMRASVEQMLTRTHTHFTYELLFARNCRLTLITEHGVSEFENQVVIVPPGLKHCSALDESGGYNLLVLPQNVAGDRFDIAADKPTALDLDEALGFYIARLAEEWNSDAGTEVAEHLAALILHGVFGKLLGQDALARTSTPTAASPIGIIEGYINGNYEKNIKLGDLSEEVHLCEKQVARIIRREYGVTLPQLLTQKRVGAAEMLLKNSDLKISEIAARVSPTEENYFFKIFKAQTGMSPLQYRKTYRK